jgi:hypothetical protein
MILTAGAEIKSDWFYDSGAAKSVTYDKSLLTDVKPYRSSVTVEDGARLDVEKKGKLKLVVGKATEINIKEVLVCKSLEYQIISSHDVAQAGLAITITRNGDLVSSRRDNHKQDIIGKWNGDSYVLLTQQQQQPPPPEPVVLKVQESITDNAHTYGRKDTSHDISWELLHRRLGHIGSSNLRKVIGMVDGIQIKEKFAKTHIKNCQTCLLAKATQSPHPSLLHTTYNSSNPIHTLHIDTSGPLEPSITGDRYFVPIVTSCGAVTGFTVPRKSDIVEEVISTIIFLQQETGHNVKVVRTDNGTEFHNKRFIKFLRSYGIKYEPTVPYNPSSNGKAEKTIDTLTTKARCLLQDSDLPTKLWPEAVKTSIYLNNRSPHSRSPITPIKTLTGRRPNLSQLCVWGSVCFAHIPSVHQAKFGPVRRSVGLSVLKEMVPFTEFLTAPLTKCFVEIGQ